MSAKEISTNKYLNRNLPEASLGSVREIQRTRLTNRDQVRLYIGVLSRIISKVGSSCPQKLFDEVIWRLRRDVETPLTIFFFLVLGTGFLFRLSRLLILKMGIFLSGFRKWNKTEIKHPRGLYSFHPLPNLLQGACHELSVCPWLLFLQERDENDKLLMRSICIVQKGKSTKLRIIVFYCLEFLICRNKLVLTNIL